jgi:hypothetical protein
VVALYRNQKLIVFPIIVTLGERQNFAVKIYTGKQGIKEGTFKLSSLSEGLEIPVSSEYSATIKEIDSGRSFGLLVTSTLFPIILISI